MKLLSSSFLFKIKGALKVSVKPVKKNFISCLLCASRDEQTVQELLGDLSRQSLNKDSFEVVILDNSAQGLKKLTDQFAAALSVVYVRNASSTGMLGALRNATLEASRGEFICFLDDDTRILQEDFLQKALEIFQKTSPDLIMPLGKALCKEKDGRDRYLDPYSYAARCCLYQRRVIEALGGFHHDLAAYEDIDLGIRSRLAGVRVFKTDQLQYAHPGLFFTSLQKPLAIGQSVLKLRKYYPWYLWLLIYLNALRFLPLGLIPTTKNRQWFKISLGVLMAPFVRKECTYRG